jgi:hypothetical protein
MQDAPAVTPPNAAATAAAQTASNKETAITQAELNNYNKVSPDGSMTYTQTGTNADGTPQFTQTTNLSASNQGIYDTNQITKQNIAKIGQDQSTKIGDLLGTPFSVDQSIANKITSLGKTQLDPQWAANDSKQAASLANQGITPGSEAYDNAMRSYSAAKNSAYNQLYLQGDAQAESESLANRNQPINEITALLNGTQVSTPTFAASPQTSVGGTDVAGITQNAYADQNQQAQQSVAANNAMMGGLFSLAGTGATAAIKYSDERLKTDIRKVAETDNDLPIYSYRYKSGGPKEIGLMAQDVEKKVPGAVLTDPKGWKMVNYARALEAA